MLDESEARVYRELWHLTDAADPPTHVLYVTVMPGSEDGIFMTKLDDRDHLAIWIRRERRPDEDDVPDVAGATLTELITLAHERGHEQSYRAGTYEANTMREEQRAWDYARVVLVDTGTVDRDVFSVAMNFSMNVHRSRGTPD